MASDDLKTVREALEATGEKALSMGFVLGGPTRTWYGETIAYAWRVDAHKEDVCAEVIAQVTHYQSVALRRAAPRPIKLDFTIQARRINPRGATEPVRVKAFDLQPDETPSDEELVQCFYDASIIASDLVGSLEESRPVRQAVRARRA